MRTLVIALLLGVAVAGFGTTVWAQGRPQRPPADARQDRGGSQYTLEQACSDRAQLTTIAFSGLAFLTGDFGACTFMPPGKVCDFFGFQYMRDIDATQSGHNPKFLDRVAGNVLKTLNDEQRATFQTAAKQEAADLRNLALKRLVLIKAFCRELKGEIPAGSKGLNEAAVVKYVGDFFAYDAEIAYRRAQVFGKVAASFTPDQKAYLAKMKFGDFGTWPEVDMDQYKLPRGSDKMANVAYMTYASEFFSWYAGSVEADTYFCPERHGTYFGGFYMKDMPAMGKKDFNISTSRTGDSGEAFLDALTPDERASITSIVPKEHKALLEICDVRRAISTQLRAFLKGNTPDKDKVVALGRRYGELDGEMSFAYAEAFAKVNKTLTDKQRATFMKLRDLEGYTSAPAYIYSDPVQAPEIGDADFLFRAPGATTPTPAAKSTSSLETTPTATTTGFVLRSSEVKDGGDLPKQFTGDGEAATLPLEWSGAPAGTKSYAIVMHHVAPDMVKWYWIIYNIPANVTNLEKNAKGVGTLGTNSINGRTEYAPPHSKGPGQKTYILTVYALSAPPEIKVTPEKVDRATLLAAIKDRTLATAELHVNYTRDVAGNEPPPPPADR